VTWNCTIEMSREAGIQLVVTDKDQQSYTKLELLGNQLKLTVHDSTGESTITQEPKRISIVCPEVAVEADKITLTAKQELRAESQNTMVIQSQNRLSVAAAETQISADASLKLSAPQVVAKASAGLTLSADVQAKLHATQVTVSSDGMLDLAANGIATLKGALVNISGNLINLG